MKLKDLAILLLFVLGFIVRLYRFDNPVADWHAFRQGDTNAVSQIYVRDGINLLSPRYFDISNIQSGKDNPKGYRLVEFPIYNAVQAFLFTVFKTLTLPEWGRIISIIATLSGAFFVYKLVKKYANEMAGIFSAFFYLFLPFSIFYGRTILPDPSMAAAILGGIYFFDLWTSRKNFKFEILDFKFLFAILFTATSFLLKPYAIIFTLPMIYLAWNKFKFEIIKKWQLWFFAIVTLIPIVLWRKFIGQHPEGIPVSDWLFNGNGIRFRPSFFRWIFYERITRLILGFSGVVFLLDGILYLFKNKNKMFFLSFAVSSLIYLFVIATGNVQHDYYQILIIPTISIFAGLGAFGLFKTVEKWGRTAAIGVCSILIVVSLFFSWRQVRDYFNINDTRMVHAAAVANKILPADATVIAPYDGSTTFLNLIQRRGWPTFEKGIEELTRDGAQYLVIASPTKNDFSGFGKTYQHVAAGPDYLILKLK